MAANSKAIRLSLEVSPQMNDKLEELADKMGGTKSDVLRKAVALIEVAVRAKEEGRRFGIAAPDQTLATEIVGL
jgi:predicted transcriptional regulator